MRRKYRGRRAWDILVCKRHVLGRNSSISGRAANAKARGSTGVPPVGCANIFWGHAGSSERARLPPSRVLPSSVLFAARREPRPPAAPRNIGTPNRLLRRGLLTTTDV